MELTACRGSSLQHWLGVLRSLILHTKCREAPTACSAQAIRRLVLPLLVQAYKPVGVEASLGVVVGEGFQEPGAHAAAGATSNAVRQLEALQRIAVARLPVCTTTKRQLKRMESLNEVVQTNVPLPLPPAMLCVSRKPYSELQLRASWSVRITPEIDCQTVPCKPAYAHPSVPMRRTYSSGGTWATGCICVVGPGMRQMPDYTGAAACVNAISPPASCICCVCIGV